MRRPAAYTARPAPHAGAPPPMKAVFLDVPHSLLDERRKTGADRWDEVWDGVLHLVPSPTIEHQDLEGALEAWLRRYWVPRSGGRVHHQVSVARVAAGAGWVRY